MKHDFDQLVDLLGMVRTVDMGVELNKVYDPPKGSLKLKDLAKVYDFRCEPSRWMAQNCRRNMGSK